MRLIYHPAAQTELIEAAQFYERRVSTPGSQFLDAAEITIGVILNDPERWSAIEADVRRDLLPRFPYALNLRVHSDHIRILAFEHNSRHPDYRRFRSSDQSENT